MDKVYDAFIDDYIDRENMELNAPPERYMEITSDLLIKNAARWFIEDYKAGEPNDNIRMGTFNKD